MRIKIGIFDKDLGYSLALMEYINYKAGSRYNASCFSSKEALMEYLATEQLHIVLAGENLDIPFSGITLSLSGYDTDSKLGRIYKYQSVALLLKDIERVTSDYFNLYESGKMYFVYSPLGRSGKTKLAMALCKHRRDSFYLGFEDYGSDSEAEIAVTDKFLFYLKSHNSEIKQFFERKSIHAGYLFEDIREVTEDDFRWLKDQYLSLFPRGVICIDMGIGALGCLETLLAGDKTIIPIVEDWNEYKIDSFYKKIEHEKLTELKVLEIKITEDTNFEELIGANDL